MKQFKTDLRALFLLRNLLKPGLVLSSKGEQGWAKKNEFFLIFHLTNPGRVYIL